MYGCGSRSLIETRTHWLLHKPEVHKERKLWCVLGVTFGEDQALVVHPISRQRIYTSMQLPEAILGEVV